VKIQYPLIQGEINDSVIHHHTDRVLVSVEFSPIS